MSRFFLKNYARFLEEHRLALLSLRKQSTRGIDSGTTNVTEIEKFRTMASSWWDKNGPMKGLHMMNPLRVSLVCDGLKQTETVLSEVTDSPLPLKGMKILDVGCGGGIMSEALAMLGASVSGLDPCQEVIDVARFHSSQNPTIKDNINYICGTIEDFCKENNKYDAVVASEVFEHVGNLDKFLACCVKLMKNKGSMFITTINRTWLSYIFGIVVAEQICRILPRGTHQWENFVLPSELQQILEKNGCRVRLLHGTLYQPWSARWRWWNSLHVCYAVHAIRT